MGNAKKSCDDFVKEVIEPIEKKVIDNGDLYVLVEGYPTLDLSDFTYKEYPDESNLLFSSKKPGLELSTSPTKGINKWQEISNNERERRNNYYFLETLSGLIWNGKTGGQLFRAEYKEDTKKIEHLDYAFYALTPDELKKSPQAQSRIFIDNCMNLGVKAIKARITERVNIWTPYLLWLFAIDCVERQFLIDETIPDICRQGLQLARMLAKYYCGIERTEIINYLKYNSKSTDINKEVDKKISEMKGRINEYDPGYGEVHNLKKVLNMCIDTRPPNHPFSIAREIQAYNAIREKANYRSKYNYPGILTKDNEETKISERIFLAFAKEELDWQVQHLNIMLAQ